MDQAVFATLTAVNDGMPKCPVYAPGMHLREEESEQKFRAK
jgi:hypothetical protein